MTSNDVLKIFKEITTVPRESGHEEKIIKWLLDFAKKHNLKAKKDKVGNVLIVKEADKGCEKVPTLVLQSHSDMVCEKNAGVEHDFAKDPIKYCEEKGWLVAKDTTLGADCGIGMAAQLAVVTDKTLKTGKIEALFTISEETGMDGVIGLEPEFITGRTLLNLDSEDEGELCIGCAGGVDTTAYMKYKPWAAMKDSLKYKLRVYGSMGGHSGDDINKNRVNACQQLCRLLYELMTLRVIELYEIDGGNKRNAIAREAHAIIGFPKRAKSSMVKLVKEVAGEIEAEFAASDPGVKVEFVETECDKKKIVDPNVAHAFIYAAVASPHGVYKMDNKIKDLVEVSTNFASIKMEDNCLVVATSQRSPVVSERVFMAKQVEACWAIAGARVRHSGDYPGWVPNWESPVLERCKRAYKKLFNKEAKVVVTPCGLECGMIGEKMPDMDMVSFGPTLRGVHAPGEKLDLASLDKFCKLLGEVVCNI